jgi:hypothetical protein
MEKYLFTDGTNVIREVESKEELLAQIQSAIDPAKVRIWLFNTSEWINIAEFNKRFPPPIVSPVKKFEPVIEKKVDSKPSKNFISKSLLKKTLIGIVAAAAIFLVYNFTKVTWRKGSPLTIMAARPLNTPPLDADSLIETIELLRGVQLDKITRTNLRIRNTWPDRIQLQLTADRDISREGSRFYNLEFSIDNSTGYNIDNAEVKLTTWKDDEVSSTNTVKFSNIGYAAPAKRKIEGLYSGDSISVAFSSIRSRVFNFCYSVDKKSNYGNYNDRWFCKE